MKLKFLQWNIWYKEDVDRIVEEIKRFQADVITAQEFIQHSAINLDTAKYIADKLGFNYFYHTADTWSGREEKEAQGNAVFSRFPIKKTEHTYISPPRHNPVNALEEGRIYVETTLDINGKSLVVGTTHLSFTPHFEITEPRKIEADNLIKVIKNKKSNYIFGADLNAGPDSYVIKEFEKYLQNVGPNYDEKTFANQPFDYYGMYQVEGIEWRLDYVFASDDIKVIKAEVMQTKYSDHLPILAEIEI
jgi:endonuclease/exonuclease/phosphatase family metal-dependent hydrolase